MWIKKHFSNKLWTKLSLFYLEFAYHKVREQHNYDSANNSVCIAVSTTYLRKAVVQINNRQKCTGNSYWNTTKYIIKGSNVISC